MRRLVLFGCLLLRLMPFALADEPRDDVLMAVDHLVLAAPDLDEGIAAVEAMTGVRASYGGSHPGLGTRNALLSLGPRVYLEIIAPDPAQSTWQSPRPFRVDEIQAPTLVTWAAKSGDVEGLVERTLPGGESLGTAQAGSRKRPDGVTLSWVLSVPTREVADGVVPFFIDWGDTPHPAASAPSGVTLIALRLLHPEPGRVRETLDILGIDAVVTHGARPALIAELMTPNGAVTLE